MLVLSRKLGERIVIGDNLVVTVVAVDHGKVRLGFEAPESVAIRREELLFDPPIRRVISKNGQRSPECVR